MLLPRETPDSPWSPNRAALSLVVEGRPIHVLFDERASLEPSRRAIVCQDRSLTYGQLSSLTNDVASGLIACGITPGSRVGVLQPRSERLIAALIGVLKVGACCVPLDVAYPSVRLEQIIGIASLDLIIVDSASASAHFGVRTLAFEQLIAAPIQSPLPVVSDSSLAFIFFTSGSTGTPKGVMMTHRARIASVRWLIDNYGCPQAHLFKSSVTHNPMVREIFWPLLTGGEVIVFAREGQTDLRALLELVRSEHVGVVGLTPSLLEVLLERLDATDQARDWLVICGGEPIKPNVIDRFRSRLPRARLLRFYGLTEAGMALHREVAMGVDSSSLGFPTYLLTSVRDSEFRQVDAEMDGELCLSGVGLASGYLGDPQLTAARFRHDPDDATIVWFATGDRVRRKPDGEFVFLGRVDRMVKVRGVRVELGEIEAQLSTISGVGDAAVVAFNRPGGQLALCAFLTVKEAVLTADGIRLSLLERLPRSMLPHALHVVDSLPLLPNDKLDYARLKVKAIELEAPDRLHSIFESTFATESPNEDQRFFADLGGDSLLAVELMTAVAAEFGVELPTVVFAKDPTIGELRRFVLASDRSLPDLASSNPTGQLEAGNSLSSTQRDHLRHPWPFYFGGFRCIGPLDAERFAHGVDGCFRRYVLKRVGIDFETLRVTTCDDAGYDPVSLNVLTTGSADERRLAAVLQASIFFRQAADIREPAAFELTRITDNEWQICMRFSMLFFDGRAIKTFLKALSSLYSTGECDTSALTFGQYAAWEAERFPDDVFIQSYFAREVAALRVSSLRKCGPPSRGTIASGVVQRFSLEAGSYAALTSIAKAAGVSRNRAIIGVIAAATARFTGSQTLSVDVMSDNRNVGLSRHTLGPLAVRVPLLFEFDGGGWQSWASQTKAATARLLLQHNSMTELMRLTTTKTALEGRILITEVVGAFAELPLAECRTTALSLDGTHRAIPLDPFTDVDVRFSYNEGTLSLAVAAREVEGAPTPGDMATLIASEVRSLAAELERSTDEGFAI